MTIAIRKPDYWVSVGNAYFYDDAMTAPEGVNSIKEIGISEDKAEQKLYGSGIVYEVVSQTTSTQITVTAIQLPEEWTNKYLGRTIDGAFNMQTVTDRLKEFSFGYTVEYSDGKKIFKWFPRCQMTLADETIATRTADPVDPQRQYTIVAMPTAEGVVRVSYDQQQVTEGEAALTEDEFFAQVLVNLENKPTHTAG